MRGEEWQQPGDGEHTQPPGSSLSQVCTWVACWAHRFLAHMIQIISEIFPPPAPLTKQTVATYKHRSNYNYHHPHYLIHSFSDDIFSPPAVYSWHWLNVCKDAAGQLKGGCKNYPQYAITSILQFLCDILYHGKDYYQIILDILWGHAIHLWSVTGFLGVEIMAITQLYNSDMKAK